MSTANTVTVDVPYESGSVTWPHLANGESGQASPALRYKVAFFQASGVFGVGGSVKLQGSNDGATWTDLPSAAMTGPGFFAPLTTFPKFIRPVCTAGDGTTDLNIRGWFS